VNFISFGSWETYPIRIRLCFSAFIIANEFVWTTDE